MKPGTVHIHRLAGEGSGDMEPGLPHLDDAVACDQGAADSLPADGALLVSWAGWVGLRCRIPRLGRPVSLT